MQDAIFILIMNLGEHTEALSDINIFSMSYEGDQFLHQLQDRRICANAE